VNLALGIVFLWLGAACIYVAVHGLTLANGQPVKSPWDAYNGLLSKIKAA
jgi:hypothetical protein